MKTLFYIFFFLLSLNSFAQKTVVKEVDFNNQNIEIQLGDIDFLEIVHTDQQKVSISMRDYPENPSRVDLVHSEKVIKVKAFRIIPFQVGLKTEKFCYEQPLFPSYKLALPKGCNITITFENGNFSTQNFIGNLNLRLNIGDLTIDNFEGNVNAELFSGNIDAIIKNTEFDILSKHGKITTNFLGNNLQKTDISLKGTLGVNNNRLTIKSIKANIVLNTSTTQ